MNSDMLTRQRFFSPRPFHNKQWSIIQWDNNLDCLAVARVHTPADTGGTGGQDGGRSGQKQDLVRHERVYVVF